MSEPCEQRDLISLRDHFERLLTEHEKRDDLLHQASDKALKLAHDQNEMWRKNSSDLQTQIIERERQYQMQARERDRQFLPRSIGVVGVIVAVLSLIITLWAKMP